LRDGVVTRQEVQAEIAWRKSRDGLYEKSIFVITALGAIAAIVAAIEGWPPKAFF